MSTLSTPKLDLLWPVLLTTRKTLLQTITEPLAAPFWSAADESYRSFKSRFMLVGRATSGCYDAAESDSQLMVSPRDALTERKALNRHIVKNKTIGRKSSFWHAFVTGSRYCGETETFENAVWSNLTKIGFTNRDVDNDLFHSQEELAENTLRAELEEYKPTIVHFAVNTLGGQCILRATATKKEDWTPLSVSITDPLNSIWFLNSGKLKAIWTRHPNRARRELVQAWSNKLQELVDA
jgi:hypothetical protein